MLDVDVENFFDVHPPTKARGDNRAGAGSGDEFKVIREEQIRIFRVFAEHPLDLDKNLQGENAPYAAAIECEDALHKFICSAACDDE